MFVDVQLLPHEAPLHHACRCLEQIFADLRDRQGEQMAFGSPVLLLVGFLHSTPLRTIKGPRLARLLRARNAEICGIDALAAAYVEELADHLERGQRR